METTMRGSITTVLRKLGCGFVLTESGEEIFFSPDALDGIGIDHLEEGQCVEVELYDLGIGRATIKHIRCESCRRSANARCA